MAAQVAPLLLLIDTTQQPHYPDRSRIAWERPSSSARRARVTPATQPLPTSRTPVMALVAPQRQSQHTGHAHRRPRVAWGAWTESPSEPSAELLQEFSALPRTVVEQVFRSTGSEADARVAFYALGLSSSSTLRDCPDWLVAFAGSKENTVPECSSSGSEDEEAVFGKGNEGESEGDGDSIDVMALFQPEALEESEARQWGRATSTGSLDSGSSIDATLWDDVDCDADADDDDDSGDDGDDGDDGYDGHFGGYAMDPACHLGGGGHTMDPAVHQLGQGCSDDFSCRQGSRLRSSTCCSPQYSGWATVGESYVAGSMRGNSGGLAAERAKAPWSCQDSPCPGPLRPLTSACGRPLVATSSHGPQVTPEGPKRACGPATIARGPSIATIGPRLARGPNPLLLRTTFWD
eukprot:m.185657 g.185657  ORF g.185657 m.185657 type:complete len:406 (+) comp18122_c2_seq5:391-1608(+)